jgi:hypothetical protein
MPDHATPPPSDDDQPATKRPDYEDFRDESGQIDWLAFRRAVAAYDPDTEAPPSGG